MQKSIIYSQPALMNFQNSIRTFGALCTGPGAIATGSCGQGNYATLACNPHGIVASEACGVGDNTG